MPKHLIFLSVLVSAFAFPASALANAAPLIAGPIQGHWTNVPAPTGTAEVTIGVRQARTVKATAAGKTWKLHRLRGTSVGFPPWTGAIHDRKATNYFARLKFNVKITACNSSGCMTSTKTLRNG